MTIAISCLGMKIETQYPITTWQGYLQLRYAEKYAGYLAESLLPHLALNTFLLALRKRNRNIKKVFRDSCIKRENSTRRFKNE